MSFGYISLLIAFVTTAYSLWAGFTGIKLKKPSFIQNAEYAIYGQFLFVTLSVFLLAYAFLTRDFSIQYVAEYSDRQLPLLYTISGVWAGQAGSLLFWTWLLTILNAAFVFFNRKGENIYKPYVFTIHSAVTFFFLVLVVYSSNPFEKLHAVLQDGYGLNPLLQNPEMIFHPPTLFMGFAAVTIPFAYAITALIKGDSSNQWLDRSRNWALFSWVFLTIGNLLGAQWAYVELGWGGYWAWDPVENASLLPWLTATAFLHSLMAQKSRGIMKAWNVSLIILTFLLTILGTFITRSGIISSVHAFGRSNIGTLFLFFMIIVFVVALLLISLRWDKFKSIKQVDSFLSRDFSFLSLNIIFIVLMFAILFGTLYPAFSELFVGKQITLGEKFFNKISIPFGLALLVLLAVCPIFSWKNTTSEKIKKRLIFPLLLSILFSITLFLLGVEDLKALFTFSISILAVSIMSWEIGHNVFSSAKNENFNSNIRRYAAYLIHLGVIFIYIAIAGTTIFKHEKEITLQKGESVSIGGYTLQYEKMGERHEQNKDILTAELSLFKGEKKLGMIIPQRHFYRSNMRNDQQTSEVAVRTNLKEDLYVILASYQEDESATFVFMINPLMIWMWIGGIVMTVGVFIILIYSKKKEQYTK